MHGALGLDILIVPDELDLLPDIAEEAIDMLLAEVIGTVEPIGAENADVEVVGLALARVVEGVVEGGAVVPLEVVEEGAELVLDDVEIARVGPVVPQVHDRQLAAVIDVEDGVELERPCGWGGRGLCDHCCGRAFC